MAKTLYVIISDGGDGSYYPQYTMNTDLINKMQEAYDLGLMHYDNGIGCDGDGFHFDTITIPDECTPDSLGISVLDDDYADEFFENAE
ncbi:hypothetical protein RsoM2USA_399 [Ralstonia phage RsoM2USA]|nr:hypothetical protein RsoM2USA_399 [Ralstonia phage RsoM2USA]